VVKCNEGLSNRVSNIIRRCVDHMKFADCVVFLFITFFHVLLIPFFIIVYTVVCFCMLLFNFVNYVFIVMFIYFNCYVYKFLLLCMFCSVYSVFILLFYVLFVCKCVLYYCHRVNPIAINKYIIMYHIHKVPPINYN